MRRQLAQNPILIHLDMLWLIQVHWPEWIARDKHVADARVDLVLRESLVQVRDNRRLIHLGKKYQIFQPYNLSLLLHDFDLIQLYYSCMYLHCFTRKNNVG